MIERAVAIRLKIPDNEAYTTMVTLRRLGIPVDRVERSEIWEFEDGGSASTLARRVEANETVFNPNKHRLAVLDEPRPRPGEAWVYEREAHDEIREHLGGKAIEGITNARRYVGWRLFDAAGAPMEEPHVVDALERLLCNPAIENARYAWDGADVDMQEHRILVQLPELGKNP